MKKPKWVVLTPQTHINFIYTNHRGVREKREAIFLGVDYGSNSWYPEEQWFLRCKALDRDGAERSFAINNISDIQKTNMIW
jgi:hypothetical protein